MRKSALVTRGWGPRPLHTLTSLECEQWPLQVLRHISEVHLYPYNADPSQKLDYRQVLCLFTQHQEPVQLNRASVLHGKKCIKHDMTPICKHFPFLYFAQFSACAFNQDTRFFFSIKLRNMWERHVFVHILLQNNLWSWQASVCFREAATKQSLTKQVHSKKVRAFNYRVTAKAKLKK